MIIHRDAAEGHLEVIVLFEHAKPGQIFIFYVASLVEAAHLEVPSILAKAHRKLPDFNDPLLLHDVVDGLKSIQIHQRFLTTQTQDAISLLGVEVLGLRVHTAKRVFKHVDSEMEVLAEVHAILGDKAFIARPFSVTLVKVAMIAFSASTVNGLAVVKREVL